MWRTMLLISSAAAMVAGPSEFASAQVVRVGGGVSVRAPFVRVEVGPNGETWVRAPFTNVFAPGHPFYVPGPVVESRGPSAPPVLPGAPAAVPSPTLMNWSQLRQEIRNSSAQLNRDLGASAAGAVYRRTLRTGMISDLVSQDVDQPPDVEMVEQLGMQLATFDALSSDPAAAEVTRLESFHRLHQAMHEFLAPPLIRQQRQLSHSARALQQTLARYSTGADWYEYLLLSDEMFSVRDDLPLNGPITDQELQQARKILRRFEKVAGGAEYDSITRLPDFQTAFTSLRQYVAMIDAPATGAVVEELPAPDRR